MGIMNLFKKKSPSHEEKVAAAYKCFKADMVEMVFPGKHKQAGCVVTSLAKICGYSLESCDAKRYFDLLSIYTDILIRRVITQTSNEMIVASLQTKHKEIVTTAEKARMIVAYTFLNMNDNNYTIADASAMELVKGMAGALAEQEQVVAGNDAAAAKNTSDPDYGLVVQKPIYTHGIGGSKAYLSRLKTIDGVELTWERAGSTSCDGVKGIIDIYEGYLPSGKLYKTLYVNMYGSTDSKTAPAGFKF